MQHYIYIFLRFTCPICKKTKTYILMKTKAFFKTKDSASPAKRRLSGILSKNTQTGDSRHQTMIINKFETANYFSLQKQFHDTFHDHFNFQCLFNSLCWVLNSKLVSMSYFTTYHLPLAKENYC